jgi:hypothetical protein
MFTLILAYILIYPEVTIEVKLKTEVPNMEQCKLTGAQWVAFHNSITDQYTMPTAFCVESKGV